MVKQNRASSIVFAALRVTVTAVVLAACQSDGGVGPGDNPNVAGAFPSRLPPTATYDDGPATIRISGSGFAPDATVSFESGGQAEEALHVDSAHYVSPTELIATLTIAANAKAKKYDIVVKRRSGKKGIGSETFTIAKDPVFTVEIRPGAASLAVGRTFQLSARVRTGNPEIQPIVTDREVVWQSSNPEIVSVSATGLLTGISGGSATVTATSEGKTDVAPIVVGVVANIQPVASLTSGNKTTCALNDSGNAFCWGEGSVGQLGYGGQSPSSSPTPVAGGLNFAAISPAIYHSCALTTTGSAYCWGRNDQAALGDGSLEQRLVPTRVSGDLTFTVIRTGYHFSCALVATGDAYCWGNGQFGILGNSSNTLSNIPVKVGGTHKFTALAAGFNHACAIDASGAAWCWGDNRAYGLGDGSRTNANLPVAVSGGLKFSSLTAGEGSTCGLTNSGAAYCWGWNVFGEAGDGTSGASASKHSPVAVAGGLTFTSLQAGNIHVCGLATSGSVYCWGDNAHGQLGDGSFDPHPTPTAVAGGLTFTTITSGLNVTCGVAVSGVVYCWGANDLGQLGTGANVDSNVPVRVDGQP